MPDEIIKIYDLDGNEIPVTADFVKKLINQHLKTHAIVPVDSVNLLLNQRKELEVIVTQSVEMMIMFYTLIGNKLPTKITDVITMTPKLIKAISDNPDIVNQITSRLETVKSLAPKYLDHAIIEKMELFVPDLKKISE